MAHSKYRWLIDLTEDRQHTNKYLTLFIYIICLLLLIFCFFIDCSQKLSHSYIFTIFG
jgi:hypothetical protein